LTNRGRNPDEQIKSPPIVTHCRREPKAGRRVGEERSDETYPHLVHLPPNDLTVTGRADTGFEHKLITGA
jgi:hypothetical protein